jgi:hypothetical protein
MSEKNPEAPRQEVTVTEAEPWMNKPIKVVLTMQLNERHSNNQTFYLNGDEAEDLIKALAYHIYGVED